MSHQNFKYEAMVDLLRYLSALLLAVGTPTAGSVALNFNDKNGTQLETDVTAAVASGASSFAVSAFSNFTFGDTNFVLANASNFELHGNGATMWFQCGRGFQVGTCVGWYAIQLIAGVGEWVSVKLPQQPAMPLKSSKSIHIVQPFFVACAFFFFFFLFPFHCFHVAFLLLLSAPAHSQPNTQPTNKLTLAHSSRIRTTFLCRT